MKLFAVYDLWSDVEGPALFHGAFSTEEKAKEYISIQEDPTDFDIQDLVVDIQLKSI